MLKRTVNGGPFNRTSMESKPHLKNRHRLLWIRGLLIEPVWNRNLDPCIVS